MSWASIAKKAAPAIPSTDIGPDESVDVAVLDANAIISGQGLLLLAKLANRAVTTPEVLAEVRDKKSRATLEALPYTLEATEPAEEDVKAGMQCWAGRGGMCMGRGGGGDWFVCSAKIGMPRRRALLLAGGGGRWPASAPVL